MKIANNSHFNWDVCAKEKMCQYYNKRASKKGKLTTWTGMLCLVWSNNETKYAITFENDFTGIIIVYILRQNSDSICHKKIFGYVSVKRLRTDNETEFICFKFKRLLVNCLYLFNLLSQIFIFSPSSLDVFDTIYLNLSYFVPFILYNCNSFLWKIFFFILWKIALD